MELHNTSGHKLRFLFVRLSCGGDADAKLMYKCELWNNQLASILYKV
jgi:hypothetical protein